MLKTVEINPFYLNSALPLDACKVPTQAGQIERTDSLYQQVKEACHSMALRVAVPMRRFKNESMVGLKSAYGAQLLLLTIFYCCFPRILLREETNSAVGKALKWGKQFAIGLAVGSAAKMVPAAVAIGMQSIWPRDKQKRRFIKQHSDPAKQKMIDENTEAVKKDSENYSMSCIWGPIYEELLFRGIGQDLAMYRIPCFKLGMTQSEATAVYNNSTFKNLRIMLMSLQFGLTHLQNGHADCYRQAILACSMGYVLGRLKESQAGLIGAIGAHMAYNSLVHWID